MSWHDFFLYDQSSPAIWSSYHPSTLTMQTRVCDTITGGSQIYPPTSGEIDDRFDVIVDEGKGTYDLMIKNVDQDVAGLYECRLAVADEQGTADLVAVSEYLLLHGTCYDLFCYEVLPRQAGLFPAASVAIATKLHLRRHGIVIITIFYRGFGLPPTTRR